MESQCLGFLQEHWDIFFIETGKYKPTIGGHHTMVGFHIGKQYVTVDVGKHNIEQSLNMGQHTGIAQIDLHLLSHPIEYCIMTAVVKTELVNVIRYHRGRATLQGGYAENARTATAIATIRAR